MNGGGPERILIVGAGFVGSAIATAAARAGFATRVLSRSAPRRAVPWDVVVGDAGDVDAVHDACRNIDHIIFAVESAVPATAEDDPCADMARSLPPLMNVLHACGRTGCGLTMLSSGGTVYGNPQTLPVPECHPTNPISAYGIRKLAAENHALACAEGFGFNVRILRIGNAYGIDQRVRRQQGIVATLLDNLARDRPTVVYGDGSVTRDYVHVDDIAAATLSLLRAPPTPEIVNVGTGVGLSILDLISICESATDRSPQVTFASSRSFDVTANVLDISLLRRLIDFNPVTPEFAIRRIWDEMAIEQME
jgi:UDP-glucose 4-epimerase